MASPARAASEGFHKLEFSKLLLFLSTAVDNFQITKNDESLIIGFVSYKKATGNIGLQRQKRIIRDLIVLRKFLGPFVDNSIIDIYNAVDKIKNANSQNGNKYKGSTIEAYIISLKNFYSWLIEEGISNIPLSKINNIKAKTTGYVSIKGEENVLTPNEIKTLISSAKSIRDRCFISMLYEGGFRIGELGIMKWEDIKLDSYGLTVKVCFKTEIERHIRLIICKNDIANWKSVYPGIPEGSSRVFVNRDGSDMSYIGLLKRIQTCVNRSNITKHVYPHLFRHSRITHLIQEGVSESIIKLMMWGSINTTMFQLYAHLSNKDIDNEMLRHYKISQDDAVPEKFEPIICPLCKAINSPIARYCYACGQNLTQTFIKSEFDFMKFMNENQDLLIEYLQNFKSQSINKFE
jgi:site-specific recombinase XerD